VDDEADVGAVDAHAERYGGDDDQRFAGAEAGQGGAFFCRIEPGVERHGRNAFVV
jgi:hypothetical protein